MNPETLIKNKVTRWLKTQNLYFVKLSDKWVSGIPDIMIIKEGNVIFVELKSERGKLSKIQEYTITQLVKHGAGVIVARSLEEVKNGIFVHTN